MRDSRPCNVGSEIPHRSPGIEKTGANVYSVRLNLVSAVFMSPMRPKESGLMQ